MSPADTISRARITSAKLLYYQDYGFEKNSRPRPGRRGETEPGYARSIVALSEKRKFQRRKRASFFKKRCPFSICKSYIDQALVRPI